MHTLISEGENAMKRLSAILTAAVILLSGCSAAENNWKNPKMVRLR